jgi:4-amino-4-deoxy-L-arabinose transferase-like glycosyltransferase
LLVLAAALAAALRAPFLRSPLTADEGGYGEVARLWREGGHLYDGVWVDRPQGLVLVFRAALAFGGSPALLRSIAIAIAVATVVCIFQLGLIVGGRIVGIAAALLLATVGAAPQIESFTLAGELIAALPATAAVLVFAHYLRSSHRATLVAAGLLAGCALAVKQSAIDPTFAIVVTLLMARGRKGLAPSGIALACAAAPLVAALALSGDPAAWWDAVVAYRTQGDSLVTGSLGGRLDQLGGVLPAALIGLGPLLALGAVGWRRAPLVARVWLVGGLVGVLGGGNFHAHYFIQLAPPAALLAGFGVARLYAWRPRTLAVTASVAAIIAASATIPLAFASPAAQAQSIWPRDPHLAADAAVARWLRAHTLPGEHVQVLWGAASIYYLADRPPALAIMWKRPLESVPGALAELRAVLARRVATIVVLAQPAAAGDPTGATARILMANYRVAAVVDGIPILRVRD